MRILKDKFDIERIETLTDYEIIKNQEELLTWMQDINWPVAKILSEKLIPYIPKMEKSLLKILQGNDFDWKLNILYLFTSCNEIPSSILNQVRLMLQSDTELSDIKDACEEVLDKFEG